MKQVKKAHLHAESGSLQGRLLNLKFERDKVEVTAQKIYIKI